MLLSGSNPRCDSRLPHFVLAMCLALAVTSLTGGQARAQTLIWGEEFNGMFDKTWVTVPGMPEPTVFGNPVQYLGAPTTAFETVGSQGVLRMTRIMTTLQRVGFHSSETFPLVNNYVELRVNTLTQDEFHIDGLVELWLIDAANNTNFVRVCLFGSQSSNFRTFQAESSVVGYFEHGYEYQNDTWYRLRLKVEPGTVYAELRSDTDQSLLDSFTFAHDLTLEGSSFRIGVGQWMAFPPGDTRTDSAVDYIRLYGTCLESPTVAIDTHATAACPGQVTEFHATTNVGVLSQATWNRNNVAINTNDPRYTITSVGDSHTLTIPPVQLGDSGVYTLDAEGSCGNAVSEDRPMDVFVSATGDVNEDGVTNGRDIHFFAKLVGNGGLLVPGYCAADMDGSGFVDVADIPLFVTLLVH